MQGVSSIAQLYELVAAAAVDDLNVVDKPAVEVAGAAVVGADAEANQHRRAGEGAQVQRRANEADGTRHALAREAALAGGRGAGIEGAVVAVLNPERCGVQPGSAVVGGNFHRAAIEAAFKIEVVVERQHRQARGRERGRGQHEIGRRGRGRGPP